MLDYDSIVEKCTSKALQSGILLPLCGGNCGMFSLAVSKILSEKNISHKFFHATMKNTISGDHQEFNPCFHIGVLIENKVVDYAGLRSEDKFIEDVCSWNTQGIKPLFSDSNLPFHIMEKYIETWTCHRTPWTFFYNIVKEMRL